MSIESQIIIKHEHAGHCCPIDSVQIFGTLGNTNINPRVRNWTASAKPKGPCEGEAELLEFGLAFTLSTT